MKISLRLAEEVADFIIAHGWAYWVIVLAYFGLLILTGWLVYYVIILQSEGRK